MAVLHRSSLVLCYDGTIEGFLSSVFDAYALHVLPAGIQPGASAQLAFGQDVRDVPTDMAHAERVRLGLARQGGWRLYNKVKLAFLSDVHGREASLFRYIVYAMEAGRRVLDDLADERVATVERLARTTLDEREKMYQFARFEELDCGVYFARVNPRAHVVPLIMDHFVERLGMHPLVVYDEVRHIAGVYDTRSVSYVRTDGIDVPERAGREEEYQLMWKVFYDSVSNDQRYNPGLRTGNMPKRLWRNMTEFKLGAAGTMVSR